MTDDDLKAIEARWAAVTPGPWEGEPCYVISDDYSAGVFEIGPAKARDNPPEGGPYIEVPRDDLEAILHAPEDVAALVAEVKRLRGLLAAAPCGFCRGTGFVGVALCQECRGSGRESKL